MKSYVLKVLTQPDRFDDGRRVFRAWCPALRGCHAWGFTQHEALDAIQLAAHVYIEEMLEAGILPPATEDTIELPFPTARVNV